MIFYVIICVLMVISLATSAFLKGIFSNVKGNGEIVEVERVLYAFEKVDNKGVADIYFHKSDEYLAVIKTDSNIQEYIELDQDGDKLIISMKSGSYDINKLDIDIYCPTLSVVTISGSGDFETVDKIEVDSFVINILGSGDMKIDVESTDNQVNISGSGDIKGKIVCQSFSGSVTGSGDISINGNSQNATINIMGSGDFKGGEFHTKEAKVGIMGSGDVDISVENALNASIMGSGDIRYFGNPTVTKSVMGSGEIIKGRG